MDDQILADLSTVIDAGISQDLLKNYIAIVARFRKGDLDGCLSASGKFVENTFRAIEFLRTSRVLSEIKNLTKTKLAIENDLSLPEPLRILVPRIALSMIYDIRSKTGAVHVKEIDPRPIDASLAVHAASWVIAELLRVFHVSNEKKVEAAMGSLMRTYIPFIESIGGEEVVAQRVKCELELLLLLANSGDSGLSRKEIGQTSKHKASTVTKSLGRLKDNRHIHQTKDQRYYITGSGEIHTTQLLQEFAL